MADKETQASVGVVSVLNAELGITTDKPTETGMWLCSCDENNGEWCPVIIHTGKNGELMATETIGTYPLDAYHANLINIKWKKAKIRHPLTTDA
jgi:hypothetical protein